VFPKAEVETAVHIALEDIVEIVTVALIALEETTHHLMAEVAVFLQVEAVLVQVLVEVAQVLAQEGDGAVAEEVRDKVSKFQNYLQL